MTINKTLIALALGLSLAACSNKEQAADAALDVVEGHMDEAQAKFNHKKPPAEQKPQVQGESPNTKP